MNKTERKFKAYRLQQRYIDMVQDIVAYQNELPEFKESGVVQNDRSVIEEAIEHYKKYIMGGEILDYMIPRVVEEFSNRISGHLENYIDSIEPSILELLATSRVNKEMLGIGIRQIGFDVETLKNDEGRDTLYKRSFENEIMFKEFKKAYLMKIDKE